MEQITINKPKKKGGVGGGSDVNLKVSQSSDILKEIDGALNKAEKLKEKVKKENGCCGCCG